MNDFTTLFFQLEQSTKRLDKIAALETFLLKASPLDRLWMIALFTGRGPKRLVNSRVLKEWIIEKTHFPEWLFNATYQLVGDLAETLALLLPHHPIIYQSTLTEWMLTIQNLGGQNLVDKKKAIFAMWDQLSSKERLVFNKILLGGLRLGVSQSLLIQALTNVTGIEVNVIAHRLMGEWDPSRTDPNFLFTSTEVEALHTRPYPFCLAHPLDIPLEDLGPCSDWLIEWEWEGIRGQIIHRSEFLTIWSEEKEVINDRFPELVQLKEILPDGIVLDGEILAYQENHIGSFPALQPRITDKKLTAKGSKQVSVIFLAYDLLEWKGQDIRSEPLGQRRAKLETFIGSLSEQHLLRLSPRLLVNHWKEIREMHKQAHQQQAGGIQLKKLDSIYHVGMKKGEWWQWKAESYIVYGVLLYAQKRQGWKTSMYSDYTFALWDEKGQLIPFTKTYLSLNRQELTAIDRFIKSHTLERFGPVRSVKPELVFKIAFESVHRSKRHKSGIVIRSPRILQWCRDKKPENADSLATVKAILKDSI